MQANTPQALYRILFEMLLAVVVTAGLTTPTALAQRYLFGRADLETGLEPIAAAAADFNGDGKPDLAVVNRPCDIVNAQFVCDVGSVSIFLTKVDGTFRPRVDYATRKGPTSLTVGDFNGDRKLDLAVADRESDGVSILLGNGDGTFQPQVKYAAGRKPVTVAQGDFNQDGKLDLVLTSELDNTVAVLLGNGDGTFQAQTRFPTGVLPFGVATGDFNRDGKLDLVVTNETCPRSKICDTSVSILLGNGDGTFQAHVDFASRQGARFVTTADFNGDGKLDVATNDGSLFLGNGDGTLQPRITLGTFGGEGALIAADFNGDGKVDLACAGFFVALGNGDGTFVPVNTTGGVGGLGITTADFNGDGKLDLAVANTGVSDIFECCTFGNTASVLVGNGDGTFGGKVAAGVGGNAGATKGDFNRDGKLDLASAQGGQIGQGRIVVSLGNGDGAFQLPLVFPAADDIAAIAAADFNGDGALDLATANHTDSTVSIFLGNGDGTFQPRVDYPVTPNGQPVAIAVGDFNRDGNVDLLVLNPPTHSISVLLGKGDGTFQPHLDKGTPANPLALTTGDFNGDGAPDLALVIGPPINEVKILLANGDGTFRSGQDITGFSTGVARGDFNKDGKIDLAVTRSSGGFTVLTVFLGSGDGTFQPGSSFLSACGPGVAQAVTQADFNQDGKLDVAVSVGDSGGGCTSFFLGNGDGTFQSPLDRAVFVLTTGDFNRDGAPDVVVLGLVLSSDPIVSLSRTSLNLGGHAVGTSTARNITLSAPESNVTINGITVTGANAGDFTQTNTCGAKVLHRQHCTITVSFTPTAIGSRTATLTISDSAPTSPQTVVLSGRGTAP